MHQNVIVKFDVDVVLATLLAIIGVKQGDLLGPELFDFFIAAVMESWRAEHSYEHCTFRTRRDFQMAGRRPMATGDEFTVSDLEYADDTGMPFCSRADAEEHPAGRGALQALGLAGSFRHPRPARALGLDRLVRARTGEGLEVGGTLLLEAAPHVLEPAHLRRR